MNAVTEKLFSRAKRIGASLSRDFIKGSGVYSSPDSWGPEGGLYPSESAWALLRLYEVESDPIYLDAVRSIIKNWKSTQFPSGGWPLNLGKDGLKFKISQEEREQSVLFPCLPTTAGAIRTLADYERLTGDYQYRSITSMAWKFLYKHWDPTKGTFTEPTPTAGTTLRANPRSYDWFFFLAVDSLLKQVCTVSPSTSLTAMHSALLQRLQETFEGYTDLSMPLMYGFHVFTLVQHHFRRPIRKLIRDKITRDILKNSRFNCPTIQGGCGHHDGRRGIITSEAHLRTAIGWGLAMKTFDEAIGKPHFTLSDKYSRLTDWIDSMYGDGFYFEFQEESDQSKRGRGSCGKFLPCFWILGKI